MDRRSILTILQKPQYWQSIKHLFGSSIVAYWPLQETGGTAARDVINGHNGTYHVSITLGNVVSPAGKPAPTFPGTSGVNMDVSAVIPFLDVAEGTLMLWAKALNSGIWTDGQAKQLAYFFVNSNNYISIQQSGNNAIRALYNAGGSFKQLTATMFATGWFHIAITWSVSNGRVRVYRNGIRFFSDITSIGSWAGAIATALIGGGAIAAQAWKGNLADVVLLNREATPAEIKRTVSLAQWRGLSVLGDSTANNVVESWPEVVIHSWQGGSGGLINHAVAGHSIVANMDAQTAAAVSDDSKVIVIALGTNDDNAGDMNALRAEYEENIAELKASNPRATIYAMNVLPRWTDAGGGTPVDKSNIRAAIVAACTAQSITCWDAFTTPWITAGQTSDGVHPTTAGHAAIADKVLERL